MTEIELKLEGISKTYKTRHRQIEALADINLEIGKGELVCLLGQSGCGKSTLLQIAAGLEPPSEGCVRAQGELVTRPDRRLGVVFQKFSLFPWLDVTNNVAFGLKVRGVKHAEARIAQVLELVGLTGFERMMPSQLSGGMAQRVALARTIINQPEVLLMDEPFSALDAFTRLTMQDELVRIWQETGITTLFVTHDVDEAIYLGNRVVMLTPRPGRIKSIIEVPLAHPRDRSQTAFFHIRRRIYEEFGILPKHPNVSAAKPFEALAVAPQAVPYPH